jgi:Rrf2 family nitric oxide-sensitive transcriptional repressor
MAAQEAFLAELDRHTLGELVEPVAAPLAALLGLSAEVVVPLKGPVQPLANGVPDS